MRYYEIVERADTRATIGSDLRQYTGKNALISFTAIDKLGINPQSGYNTPIGIYTYPLDQKIDDIERAGTERGVEYMGDQPFLWVMVPAPGARILNLKTYSSSDLNKDVAKLKIYATGQGMDDAEFDSFFEDAKADAKVKTSGGVLWNTTRMLSLMQIDKRVNEYKREYTSAAKKTIVKWNSILAKALGYDIIVDLGDAIIHDGEPTQAVVLNYKSIKVVKKYDFSKGDINDFVSMVRFYKEQKVEASDVINSYERLPNPSPKITNLFISTLPLSAIANTIKNPSKSLKNNILKSAVGDFSNLTKEEIHFNAVTQDKTYIKFIDHPSDEVQITALSHIVGSAAYTMDVEEAAKAAIKKDPFNIEYVKNPSESVQRLAVQNNPQTLMYINNPNEELQYEAAQSDWSAIAYIPDPSERIQLEVVSQNPEGIEYIEFPTETAQLAAVTADGMVIEFIKEPTEKTKRAAVKQNGDAIGIIQDPSETVQKLSIANGGYNEYTQYRFTDAVIKWGKERGYIE